MNSPESRFNKLTSRLIADGHFKNKGDLASTIGESFLTDLVGGKKRIRIDHLIKLKDAVPEFNSEWLITSKGSMYLSDTEMSMVSEPQSTYVPGKRDITSLLEGIESRLSPGDQKLIRHLKVEIDELIEEKDLAKDMLIEVMSGIKKKLGD